MAPAWQLSRDVAVSAVPSAANSRAGSRASLTSAAASAASASAEQAPAAKQARRAGGAKRKDHEGEAAKGEELGDEVLEVLVKAVLQVSQQSRAMAACLWTTFVVPLSWGR